MIYDVLIIGAGCAGYAAGMYAGRFGLKTLVLGEMPGGTITTAAWVENYPGFERIDGFELADKLEKHAKKFGAEIKTEKVESVTKKEDNTFEAKTNEAAYLAKTVVFATGTRHKKMGIPGEKDFEHKGVSYCALCDGAFFKGRRVAVIGGSDSAAKEALILAQYAAKVFIIYRKEKIRAEPITEKQVAKEQKIEVINNANVIEIKGDTKVSSVVLDRDYQGSKELALEGIFVAIGHEVLSDLAVGIGVTVSDRKEIITDKESGTNIPGVFAAGDVTDMPFKQAIIGAAQGVAAARAAYEYIRKL